MGYELQDFGGNNDQRNGKVAFTDLLRYVLSYSVKMLEYRERNEGSAQIPGADAADLGTGELEKYMGIAARYGFDDMEIGEPGGNEQTIEQEYQAYITAPLSSKTVNILKFWEAREFINGISVLLMGHRRLTERPFLLFLRWRWTICLSKRLPSLVNAFFRRVLKQIPSEGIASILS